VTPEERGEWCWYHQCLHEQDAFAGTGVESLCVWERDRVPVSWWARVGWRFGWLWRWR
jgi:hypothetical protein